MDSNIIYLGQFQSKKKKNYRRKFIGTSNDILTDFNIFVSFDIVHIQKYQSSAAVYTVICVTNETKTDKNKYHQNDRSHCDNCLHRCNRNPQMRNNGASFSCRLSIGVSLLCEIITSFAKSHK